jgi:hypothetical protein
LGCNERDAGEIRAVSRCVAGHQGQSFSYRVCANVKVRQWRGLRAARFPIHQESLSSQPSGGVRQREALKDSRIEPAIEIGLTLRKPALIRHKQSDW